MGDAAETVRDPRGLKTIAIDLIHPNPHNPRRSFAAADLEDLANSIREKGLLQPLMLRPRAQGDYEIVAGERRWRAAQMGGGHELPALVKDLSDVETLEIALIENVQRQDLNPVEEAEAYSRLIAQFGHSQEALGKKKKKKKNQNTNLIPLLDLPASVLDILRHRQ
ncbi:MAG TPA: ParB/RepB/Spo0J family partition protein, partial [Aestuariivirga sp.]|nr:ParB/RepB/Spo0J family partition protein [Aestuariivirga sp.]